MDQTKFRQNLARVSEAITIAQKNGETDSIATLDAIQKKLATLPLNTPDASRAISSLVNYASFVREKTGLFPNAAAAKTKTCGFIQLGDGKSPVNRIVMNLDGGAANLNGCTARLDGLSIKNFIFVNAIVRYDGGAVRLENVRFINCLFVIFLPVQPSAPARQFADELLVKNIGAKPAFTASVG